ncbi:MAG: M48 family metalloprotease [Candidatus Heimdallarchaeota archaeon]|nr:M48 family metalloprotease [Candidatus Heimdallarchaeota archaeon]
MVIAKTSVHTQIKMHLINFCFFILNIFHIIFASMSDLVPKDTGFLRFKISAFSQFNANRFLIAFSLFLIQLIFSYLFLARKFRKANLVRVNELGVVGKNNIEIRKNLRIDPKSIYNWVQEEAAEYKIKSVKRVYLTDTNIPNAMTIDVIPLPFVRSSWLVLDANLIEILDEREIRAVIAHELGHVKYLDGLVNLFRFGVNFFVFIAYSLKIFDVIKYLIIEEPSVENILLRILFLLVFIAILWGFTLLNNILMNYSRRQAEFMADYFSAKKIGRDHIINALILLGQRLDVVAAFGTEFKWLGYRENKSDVAREFLQGIKELSAEELSKDISRKKAVYIYVHQRLKNMKNDLFIPITNEQIKEMAEQACEKLLKLREDEIKSGAVNGRRTKMELNKLIIDWFTIDENQDRYLDDKEIERLVEILENNPHKELFENDIGNRRMRLGRDHPSMRERIIFLYNSISSNKNLES